jgi:hypothetical protein
MMICERLHIPDPALLMEWRPGLLCKWRGHLLNQARGSYGRQVAPEAPPTLTAEQAVGMVHRNRQRAAEGLPSLSIAEYARGDR